ncbi:serine protease Do [Tistlia consotensis]|uniref:Probable periplasmic serine endoprotease DegP-like n=1 Tax=Tistlia consotensis USBA 355 TaxID=560819 RepID=A0A1Y6B4G2_9PROT|nr:DegQ family serine endoprotease [Tistlia consotensis]SME91351.1 serine protease Do [Tistlia consotensis USBA 355]SNR27336.1 serine protease Do [Tistlia consotensis]
MPNLTQTVAAPIRRLGPALVVVAAACLATAAPAAARSAPESFADLVAPLLDTVVNVQTSITAPDNQSDGQGLGDALPDGIPDELQDLFRQFLEKRGQKGGPGAEPAPRRRENALGSGFIIDADGYIVTNNHVVEGADEISVRLTDNTILPATLVGADQATDLALLKVEAGHKLHATRWGDSDKLRIGDWVVAIGNPFGLGGTVTAGIVSARGREIGGRYDDYLQTDAAINRGNSGGPMFNTDGEVVGINTAIYSPTGGSIGIGFAVPSAMARSVIDSLRQYGEVRRGWLGVRIQTVTPELAEGLRLGSAHGALVASVTPGGPAQKAGIAGGDVIVEFDGRPVGEMSELPRMVAQTAIGKTVPVKVVRKGEEKTIQVQLGRLDEAQIAAAESGQPAPEAPGSADLKDLGLGLATLTDDLRQKYSLEQDLDGVLVTEVKPDSPADERGLRQGDVILEVNQNPVAEPADVAKELEATRKEGRSTATLLIQRGGERQWVPLKVQKKG